MWRLFYFTIYNFICDIRLSVQIYFVFLGPIKFDFQRCVTSNAWMWLYFSNMIMINVFEYQNFCYGAKLNPYTLILDVDLYLSKLLQGLCRKHQVFNFNLIQLVLIPYFFTRRNKSLSSIRVRWVKFPNSTIKGLFFM